MKINILLITLIILTAIGATHYLDNQSQEQTTYNQVEDFKIELLSGKNSSLSTIADNKDIIIHFWATWCTPCLVELPDLMSFAEENKKNVRVLAIAVQDSQNKIDSFLTKNNIHIPDNVIIAVDPNWSIAKKIFKTTKLPESFYLNKDRQTLARHNGAVDDWRTSPWIEKFINKSSE